MTTIRYVVCFGSGILVIPCVLGFKDGFLFPYQEALELAEEEDVDPEEFVAFAPDECFDSYSYGS